MPSWIKLRVPAFGQPANTVLRVDSPGQAAQLLNGGFADTAADPGGAPPAVPTPSPGGDFTTDAELAAALAGLGAGGPGVQGPAGPKGDTGVKGDPGATGATGAKGDPGVKGDPGATGATGPQGPQGTAGSSATVTDATMAAAYGPSTGAKVTADPLLKAAYVVRSQSVSTRRASAWQGNVNPPAPWTADNTHAGVMSRHRMRVPVAGRNVEIKFGTVSGAGENALPGDGSPITVRASVEYPAGTFHPAYSRDGNRDISISPSGGLGTLLVPGFEVPAGADWWVRVKASTTATGAIPAGTPTDSLTEWVIAGATVTDLTTTTAGQPGAVSNYSSCLSAVTYEPYAYTPCVGIIGTSIDTAKGDPSALQDKTYYNTSSPGGWALRALSSDGITGRTSPGILAVLAATSGDTYINMANMSKSHLRRQILDDARCSTFWLGGPVNDLGSGIANMQPNFLSVATSMAARGRVIGFTADANTVASTDGWITTANQTANANEATRRTFNQWLRAGAPISATTKAAVAVGTGSALLAGQPGHPLYAVIDTASALETAIDSGVLLPASRSVTDAAMTTGTATLTSATAAFTAADKGEAVSVVGAGASGAVLTAAISSVTNATTVVLDANAGTTVAGATAGIGVMTLDGIHPSQRGHKLKAAVAYAQAVPLVI